MKILSPVARKLIKNSLSWRNGNATKVATARLRRNSFVLAICLLCVPEFDAASLVIAADPRPDKKGVSVDDCGRKFVNKIPYDVFFDDPIQILKSGQPINSVSTVPEAIPSNSAKPPTNAHADRSPQGTESFWKELIPIDELRDEIKQARGLLTKFTASQGQYNQQFRQIGVQANVIAAMAEIANQHADPISWKDKALFVRQFGHQVTEAANGLGREPFANTR